MNDITPHAERPEEIDIPQGPVGRNIEVRRWKIWGALAAAPAKTAEALSLPIVETVAAARRVMARGRADARVAKELEQRRYEDQAKEFGIDA